VTQDDLLAERDRLMQLQVEVDQQLAAVEAALPKRRMGRPRAPLTMTLDDARRAHSAYVQGDRTDWATTGQREYDRRRRRTT
jgi:hypothetical protein